MKKAVLACSLLMLTLTSGSAFADAGGELRRAAGSGDQEVVRELLAEGVDVGATDGRGRTALHLAAGEGHAEVVALLLKSGADVDAKDRKGRTPLHLAAREGEAEVVALLLDGGGGMDAEDRGGWRPQDYVSEDEGLRTLLDWREAKKTNKYAAYKAFVDEHPDSAYAEAAKAKVAYLYDRECTSQTRVKPFPGGQVIEYLAPSGKPCGRKETRKKLPSTGEGSRAAAPNRAKPGVTVPPAGGIMVIEEATFDAGEIERGRPLEHAFTIKNTGTGPLTIKAKPG